MTRPEAEVVAFADPESFEDWLEHHVDHQAGVWLKLAKAGTGIASLSSDQAVDVGLCFGWISGQRKSLDDEYYLQKYVPRRARSRWSLVNVRKVAALSAAGRMRPAGLAEVRAAQADGRWNAAYESQREASVPDDLAAALVAEPRAATRFEALNRSARYRVIHALLVAPSAEARARSLARSVRDLTGTVPEST
ncbi:uncharacterized protein YdeI (YjbR/CyaY-like superfamily) [Marmoricola sp. URHA0025 HA25]